MTACRLVTPPLLSDVGSKILSSDRRIIKIWDSATGANFTNIEPADGGDINDVCLWRDSGLIVVGCDAPKARILPRKPYDVVRVAVLSRNLLYAVIAPYICTACSMFYNN